MLLLLLCFAARCIVTSFLRRRIAMTIAITTHAGALYIARDEQVEGYRR
jgi:hypothetical protein